MYGTPASANLTPEPMTPVGAVPWRETWVSVALVACVYLYVVPYYPALNNPNENVRVYMTAALVDDGTYEIGGPRARWGWVNDAACVDRMAEGRLVPCDRVAAAGTTRHYYSVKAPGASFLGVPGYAFYRALSGYPEEVDLRWSVYSMRVTGTIVPTLIFLIGFHRFLGRHTRRRHLRELAFFGVAVGSVFLGYAYLFASHVQSAACAFGAFMILYDVRQRRRAENQDRWAVSWDASTAAGFLAASASLFEYPCFVLSVVLSLYALIAIRPIARILGFALGALVPTLLMMHFQWRAFGNPLSPGHLFVENPAFRAIHEGGFFGAESFRWEGAFALLFDARLGMFATSPLLALGLVGMFAVLASPEVSGRRVDALMATLACVGLYIAICFMSNWDGGWSIGPRYLVALVPFLGFFGMFALDRWSRRGPILPAAFGLGLLLAGFVSATLPSMYYPHLMPEISVPVAQLLPVLLRHDFAPYNAGGLVNWHGSASMAPLLLVAFFVAKRSAPTKRELPSRASRVGLASGAAFVATLVVAQHFIWVPDETSVVRREVAFICKHWSPAGHDRVARLASSPHAVHAALRVELLREEGREPEAEDAQRRLDRRRTAEGNRARRGAAP